MANWQNRLELKDLWEAHDLNKIDTSQLAKAVAKRIRKLKCYKEYEDDLEEIAIEFEACDNNDDEFDGILAELYDWGDMVLPTPKGQMTRKVCWIATF